MRFEPKFWVSVLFSVDLVAAGIGLMWPSSRKLGAVMFAVGLVGLAGIFFCWPESEQPSVQPSVSINQKGATTNSPNVIGNSNTVNLGTAPETPVVSLVFKGTMAKLPLTISPGTDIYILGLNPKITEGLQTFGAGDKAETFPPIKSGNLLQDIVWRCQITNPNNETLLKSDMTLNLTFREGGSRNTDPVFATVEYWIEIPDLKPSDSFTFYLVNESPLWVVADLPTQAKVAVAGRRGELLAQITRVGTSYPEQLPGWAFPPSVSKW